MMCRIADAPFVRVVHTCRRAGPSSADRLKRVDVRVGCVDGADASLLLPEDDNIVHKRLEGTSAGDHDGEAVCYGSGSVFVSFMRDPAHWDDLVTGNGDKKVENYGTRGETVELACAPSNISWLLFVLHEAPTKQSNQAEAFASVDVQVPHHHQRQDEDSDLCGSTEPLANVLEDKRTL